MIALMGPSRRRQDDAAPHAQRLPAADERAGAHQRRRPLRHLRRPPRLDRLRPAGRHRPPRAHRLRGGEVLGALPPPARLLRGRDRPPRRADAARPRPRRRARTSRSASPRRRSSPAVSASASTSRSSSSPIRSSCSSTSRPAVSPPTTRRRSINLLADLAKKTGKTIIMTIHQPAKDEFEKFNLALHHGLRRHPDVLRPDGRARVRVLRVDRSSGPGTATSASTTRATCSTCSTCASAPMLERDAQREPERAAQHGARSRPRESGARSSSSNAEPGLPEDVLGPARGRHRARGRAACPHARRRRARAAARAPPVALLEGQDARRAGTAIMLLQAPIIGVLLALVFGGQKDADPVLVPRRAAGARRTKSGMAQSGDDEPAQRDAADDRPHRRRSSSSSCRACGSARATRRARS